MNSYMSGELQSFGHMYPGSCKTKVRCAQAVSSHGHLYVRGVVIIGSDVSGELYVLGQMCPRKL